MDAGRPQVAILGGGVGGLSAAHELAERDFDVTVYEANDRLGGKARSFRYETESADASLPAEHGFRYFPGFYRNLRDTLARIPVSGGGTVVDSLVPTSETLVASVSGPETVKQTQTPTTIREWVAAISPSTPGTELRLSEIDYFQRRLLMFLTSGRLRRERELEYVTLWEFLDAGARSRAYQRRLAEITQALVAMHPTVASTRAVCQIHVQLALDQIDPNRPAESVLNGPTSEAWIEPWVIYLRSLGVTFRTNTHVTAIESDGVEVTGVSIDGPDGSTTVTADYYIAAVPVEVMASLITPALERAAPSLAGVKRLDTAWMNGIQFYLTEDVSLTRGHQAYVDSPWALTSISQRQFWKNGSFDIGECGDIPVRGILSVNISDWKTPGVVYGRPARECTREEIKTEVWTQLTNHLNREIERLTDEMILDWVLDPAIGHDETTDRMTNASPLLINTVGSLWHRPRAGTRSRNLVLAADYVKTETDIASMESANEAARRAIRAILRRSDRSASLPTVWGLDEPRIFDPLKRQDDLAYKLGAPHPGEVEQGLRSFLGSFV
jgi:uncharacterized protein with NAD-binding domain and iron-sulfur cluster